MLPTRRIRYLVRKKPDFGVVGNKQIVNIILIQAGNIVKLNLEKIVLHAY